MKKKLLLLLTPLIPILIFAFPQKVFAQSILCNTTGINTAIGCINVLGDTTGAGLSNFILKWAIGVGSGIAFLLILYSGFMIMTSAGNPERLKAGQELLTSAISGILLLIFSIFILNLIGVKILGIFTP